jgi:hypothetical protein
MTRHGTCCGIGLPYRNLFQLSVLNSVSVAYESSQCDGSEFSGSDASPQSIFSLVDHRRHIYSLAENPGIKTGQLTSSDSVVIEDTLGSSNSGQSELYVSHYSSFNEEK